MQRFMHEDINFFQSPHPSQIKALLYVSPTRVWAQCQHHQLFEPRPPAGVIDQEVVFQEGSGEHSSPVSEEMDCQEMQKEEEIESMMPGIHRKISFSQNQSEEVMPLTPEKKPFVMDLQQNCKVPTTQKKIYSTPSSQFKLCDRGLKKLASEAYQYVQTLKKTSYKDVATRLIAKLSSESQNEIGSKGQMNIKRRVYDALNVLLALGLLKRNGNKIQGKKGNDSLMISSSNTNDNTAGKKEDGMQEKDLLMGQCQKKEEIIARKKKMLQDLQQKAAILKQLQTRNKTHPSYKNTIKMPLIMITPPDTQMVNEDACLDIWQEPNQLLISMPSGCEISGDMEVISSLKLQKSKKGTSAKK